MRLYLGVDGGGTGCRAAVAEADGPVLGRGEAGPANIASDPDGALVNILAATRSAMASAGLDESLTKEVHAALGLAGSNARGFRDRLMRRLPFARAHVVSDAVASTLGALEQEDGVVAALGTGTVFAIQLAGKVRQIGGWGLVLGDEGSGAWIGRAILSAAMAAHDGFRPSTPLLESLVTEHGGADGLVSWSLSARPADFAALAPRVMASQDAAALDVMARATADVVRSVELLQNQADLPVVVLGGLAPFFSGALARRWTVRPPLGSALDGALWLARQGRGH
ncbi:ATPase [Rubellimicrobium rubrum]|uniref:ATPase n=1 Tax=Rubellimicrobium rubrum TaxID=2585369 RepID=A0A5C4N3Y0_9RHOB|nr:BadF/BadG/BcrA/BcrD ATPase family protein [Rubellimicrobium rubrum]TNC51232.1 ATPase [Rubellimicrobium rubrum]